MSPKLIPLRDLLAELCPNQNRSWAMAARARLDTNRIVFHPIPWANWRNILIEAERRGKVNFVVAVACVEFPDHCRELQEAEAAYRTGRE